MSVDLEKIKSRIAKLLAKADNTAVGVEEAKAFNDKAFELMKEYNLERAACEASGEAKVSVRTHRELQVLKRPWSSMVLHGITHLYGCKWIFTRPSGRGPDTITIIGEESNVAMCHAICVMVLRAVQQEARRSGDGRSFMTGAGNVISQRCYDMKPRVSIAAPTTGNALMVMEKSDAVANEEYSRNLFGGALRMARASRPQIKSAGGYAAGAAYGATLPLRNNLIGSK